MKLLHAITLAFAIFTSLCGSQVYSGEPAKPSGDTILTISGNIQFANDAAAAKFDLDMLMSLETRTFETSSIWFEGVHSFTGVPLSVLLDAVGASGTMIDARAINDYTVNIPVPAKDQPFPIVAFFMDGKEMPVREKGPLWIIYPFDSSVEYQTEVIYSRSIWQLKSIDVRN